MKFTIKIACTALLAAVSSQSPVSAQWAEWSRWSGGAGYAGMTLGPYGSAYGYAVGGEAAAPFGAAAASSRTRVTVGPGGGYRAVTTKKVIGGGLGGVATAEARQVEYGSAGGPRARGTAYFRSTSADGLSYTYIDRTGLTGDPYGDFNSYESGGELAGPFGAAGGKTVQAGRITAGPDGLERTSAYARTTSPGPGTYTYEEAAGVAAGPYGAVRAHKSSVTAAPLGTTSSRSVSVAGEGGSRAVAASHSTTYISGNTLRTRAAYVREAHAGDVFTAGWYRLHGGAWRPDRWRVASIWVAPPWRVVARFCNINTTALPYDYGSTVVIGSDSVYLDGKQIASAADYADQALQLADSGRRAEPANEEEWQPLGVFGLVRGEKQEPQAVFQLAVNKDGILRGNYYDALTDSNLPVYGALDRRTQRVAWSIGDKKTVVIEAGLRNLTQDETTALVHYNTARTQQMVLVRLEQSRDEER